MKYNYSHENQQLPNCQTVIAANKTIKKDLGEEVGPESNISHTATLS